MTRFNEKEAFDLIITRRSTRTYQDKPVEREKLETVLEAGRYAPSGGNNQSCRFTVIRNRDVLEKLCKLVEEAFSRMEYDENTYSSLRSSIIRSREGGYRFHYDTPTLVVISNKRGYGNAMADSACALENMAIMANAMDLGTCYINQLHWLDEEELVREYLASVGIPREETITCALAVGYPATSDGMPSRVPLKRNGNIIEWVD
ncbi:MAG: nitroreductase family protein [Clostridia bacterium]|nr:nitroreductase family protein [Clostridia bacterium]MBQ4624219.1 nitroreductase family protein [Clostridia bacterium]